MKDLKIYISGPMTGYKNYNYPKFNRIANSLRAAGYNVYNPAEDILPMLEGGQEIEIPDLLKQQETFLATKGRDGLPPKEAWKCFLRGDIIALMKNCNAIYLLKGWKKSKGARFEMSCAKRMGFVVFKEGDL